MNFFVLCFCICCFQLLLFAEGNFDKVNRSRFHLKKLFKTKSQAGKTIVNARLSSTVITSFIDAFENKQTTEKQLGKKRSKRSPQMGYFDNGIDYRTQNTEADFDVIDGDLGLEQEKRPPHNHLRPGVNGGPFLPRPSIKNQEPTQTHQAPGQQFPNTSQTNHETPQYMLDLYARFQNDPFSQPASNIVRSFFNEGDKFVSLLYILRQGWPTCGALQLGKIFQMKNV